jgi:hypothetical protein
MSKIETSVVKPQLNFAENLQEYSLIASESENALDAKLQEIENYINTNDGKDKSDEEKDALYLYAQKIWQEYSDLLQETKYNFNLNRSQFKFLKNLLVTKMQYDVNTVFIALELEELLNNSDSFKYVNDYQLNSIQANATEITYIYHLIATHKVTGITKDARTFAEILRKIGDVSKVFNFYETSGKNLASDVQDWVAAFEEGVVRETRQIEQIDEQLSIEFEEVK